MRVKMRSILVFLAFLALTVGFGCQKAAVKNENNAVSSDGVNRITLAEAKKHFDANDATFVDTRAESAYKFERVKGAINIPAEAMEARWKEIPTDKPIIAYCSWPNEHTSAGLVAKLKEKGISNAYALLGGTKAWIDASYPTEGEKYNQSNSNK